MVGDVGWNEYAVKWLLQMSVFLSGFHWGRFVMLRIISRLAVSNNCSSASINSTAISVLAVVIAIAAAVLALALAVGIALG